jgi:hypothetical protein
MEVKQAIQENEIPTILYEANMADSRGLNEQALLHRIDMFFDSQGLEKLEK